MVFKSCGSMLPIVAVVVWGICSKGAFLAVILHPKGKAIDKRIHIVPRRTRLDDPQRTGFPKQFPFGLATASYEV